MAVISSILIDCLKRFNDFIASNSLQQPASDVPEDLWKDELGRLRVWAANIGAHWVGQSSLDYRLRDASNIRDQVIWLLHELRRAFDDLEQVLQEPDVEASDGDDSELDDIYGTEVQQIYKGVVNTIDCLFQISMAIRRSAQHDRLVGIKKADSTVFEFYDRQHVENKFPKANRIIIDRLGSAISRRRAGLKYRERNHAKLAKDLGNALNDELEASSAILPETVATEFDETRHSKFDETASDSDTSYVETLRERGGKITIPPPPKMSAERKPFECPYCFFTITVRDNRSWAHHVLTDLMPYVCVFPDCFAPTMLYSSRREWYHHLQTSHSVSSKWDTNFECPLCHDEVRQGAPLDRHLGRHLEELALFALSRTNEDETNAEPRIIDNVLHSDKSNYGDLLESTSASFAGRIGVQEEISSSGGSRRLKGLQLKVEEDKEWERINKEIKKEELKAVLEKQDREKKDEELKKADIEEFELMEEKRHIEEQEANEKKKPNFKARFDIKKVIKENKEKGKEKKKEAGIGVPVSGHQTQIYPYSTTSRSRPMGPTTSGNYYTRPHQQSYNNLSTRPNVQDSTHHIRQLVTQDTYRNFRSHQPSVPIHTTPGIESLTNDISSLTMTGRPNLDLANLPRFYSGNVPLMSGSHESYQDTLSYQDSHYQDSHYQDSHYQDSHYQDSHYQDSHYQATRYDLNDTSRPNIGRTIPTALPPGTRNDGVPAIPGSNANALPMRAVYNIAGNEKNDKATLDRNYKIQHKDFFKVGRVFCILWHENQGAKGRKGTLISNFTKGMFGEPIYSGIRRMVVVKESYQCAWCLPVTTYGGKGVAKQDVDASKHAIIHMRRIQPIRGPNEPEMTKKPIEVDPDMPDRTLDPMSRLNFSKVYTVEHNVKVLPVGMISPSSMVRFMSYARRQLRHSIWRPGTLDPDMPDRTLDSMSRLNFSKVYTVEHNVKVLPVGMISPSSMVRFMSYARSEFKPEHSTW